MVSADRRVRGRHARAVAGVPGLVMPVVTSRRAQVALCGAAGLGVALTAAYVMTGSGAAPRSVTANVLGARPAPAPPAVVSSMSSRRGDPAAMAYYRQRDPAGARHVQDVEWSGPMLRVYTNLPASDADSKTAVALCETGAAYLTARDRIPMVFVHANRAAGYPVLANKVSTHDDCRLGSVP